MGNSKEQNSSKASEVSPRFTFPLARVPARVQYIYNLSALETGNIDGGMDSLRNLHAMPMSNQKSAFIFVAMLMLVFTGGIILYHSNVHKRNHVRYNVLCDVAPRDVGSDNYTLPCFLVRVPYKDVHNAERREDYVRRIQIQLSKTNDYAIIDSPSKTNSVRFIHDFKRNQTAIIDSTFNRCYVMLLEPDQAKTAQYFRELLESFKSGYLVFKTERITRNFYALMPHLSPEMIPYYVSAIIAQQCRHMNVYLAEKEKFRGVRQSERNLRQAFKYMEFLGTGVIQHVLANTADLSLYEYIVANLQLGNATF